jgi:hypothetical protein
MEEAKVYEAFVELPDGYEVQVMVLQDYPGGRPKRGLQPSIYRSRVWIGTSEEPDPLLHRSQEHSEMQAAIDACYAMLLSSARQVISSPAALAALEAQVERYFQGAPTV